ncbi:hypothetical protein ACTFIU_000086 [Dictyostelium citrinum]
MEGIKNLPSMVKKGYYMVKLDIKKAYFHVDIFLFIWKCSHYRWKTMPFGLSTAPHIFTMLLRSVLPMLRELNVEVLTYFDDLINRRLYQRRISIQPKQNDGTVSN